jgi:hypothetical protein
MDNLRLTNHFSETNYWYKWFKLLQITDERQRETH